MGPDSNDGPWAAQRCVVRPLASCRGNGWMCAHRERVELHGRTRRSTAMPTGPRAAGAVPSSRRDAKASRTPDTQFQC
ncbi:hypothetical protein D3C74_32470 [compost metagenome]